MKQRSLSVGLVSALTAGVVLSPFASAALLGSMIEAPQDPFAVQAAVREKAAGDQGALRLQRRAHRRATDDCLERRRVSGEDLPCADINDKSTYEGFLNGLLGGATANTTATDTIRQELQALPLRDRLLVQQHASNGDCSLRLAGRGLYRLCEELRVQLGQEGRIFGGFPNDRAARAIREGVRRTSVLRDRIDQVKEVMHGSAPRGTGDYRAR